MRRWVKKLLCPVFAFRLKFSVQNMICWFLMINTNLESKILSWKPKKNLKKIWYVSKVMVLTHSWIFISVHLYSWHNLQHCQSSCSFSQRNEVTSIKKWPSISLLQLFSHRINPINLLLMGIALADMLVMVEYIPFSIHMYIANYNNKVEKVCLN